MPLLLTKRNEHLVEWMDRPDCDQELLFNTYRQFDRINRLLSGWKQIYRTYIRPVLAELDGEEAEILDIGCGGGDIIQYLNEMVVEDGFSVNFTGIDSDPRSREYLKQISWPAHIRFRSADSETLTKERKQFDIVISNHLMHHLTTRQLRSVCDDAATMSKNLVLFSDIERSDIGYLSFSTLAPLLFRNSYIVADGKISIRRSFRREELIQELPDGWEVKRRFPYRLLAIHRKAES